MDEDRNQEWEDAIRATMLPKIREIVRKKYMGYLHNGFIFKKYAKNSTGSRFDTCSRKWILDPSEIAFRVYDMDEGDKHRPRNGKHNRDIQYSFLGGGGEESAAPELICEFISI